MNIKRYALQTLYRKKILKRINFIITIEYAGRKYKLPVINNIGFRNYLHRTEAWMKEVMIKSMGLKKGVFLDVGANIGQTLMKLRSFSNVPYIGVEPNPECVGYLKELINVNKLQDCTICPVGMSNKNGLLTLFSNYAASPYSSIIEGFRDHDKWKLNQTQLVSVMRGDDLIASLIPNDDISVIKIDVEGAELEVIEGLENTLKGKRPFIISEILPAYSLETPNGIFRKERQDRLLSILKKNEYSIFNIKGTDNYEFISQIEVDAKVEFSNYVLVPDEMRESFQSI